MPKSYYMSEEDYIKEKSEGNKFFDDSMYQSISLQKGQIHEIVINISEKGSVICWDFDVMKQDVQFSVLKLDRLLPTLEESDESDSASQGCGVSSAPQHGRSSIDGTAGPIIIPKTWKIDQDFHVVEPTLICHDGESVQV